MSEVLATSPGAAGGKKLWQSKTLISALLLAVIPFVPVAGPMIVAWESANPQLVSVALGAIFGILRLITKDRIDIG